MKNILIIDDSSRDNLIYYLEHFCKFKVDNFNPIYKMLSEFPNLDIYNFVLLDLFFPIKKQIDNEIYENNKLDPFGGLYLLVYIREVLKIPNSKLKIILSTAASELQVKDLLKPHQLEYYDFFYRKSLSVDDLIKYLKE